MKLPPRHQFPLFRRRTALLLVGIGALRIFAQPVAEELSAELDARGYPTGRLNHPVLLVHGWGDSATAFGVELAEPICREPVVESVSSSWDRTGLSGFLISSGWSGPLRLKSRLHVRCADGWAPEIDRSDLVETERSFWGAKKTMESPITQSSGRTQAGGKTFLWSNWAKEIEGKKISEIDSLVAYRTTLARYHSEDLLMGYQAGSIPDVLARSFRLDTRWDPSAPHTGINHNGVYAYDAKEQASPVRDICRDATLEADRLEVGWENTGEIVSPANSFLHTPELARFRLVLVVQGLRVRCNDPGNHTSMVVFYGPLSFPFEDAKFSTDRSDLRFKPAPSDLWTVKLDPIKRIIQTKAFANPRQPFMPYWHKLTLDYSDEKNALFSTSDKFREFAPFRNPDWPDSGQAQQLLDRMRQVLDDHYGDGGWETNPAAQIDLVAHSQGGLVVRAMLARAEAREDTSLGNPLRHIRRVVTLGTPHFGTAIATDPSFLRLPESGLRADLKQRPYPKLADLKDALAHSSNCDIPEVSRFSLDPDELREYRASVQRREHFLENPPSGCLVLHADLRYREEGALGLYSSSKNGGMYLAGPLTGPWTLSMTGLPASIPAQEIGAGGMETLMRRLRRATNLGWPQGSSFIENLLLKDATYPQYPGTTSKIPFYTFHSPSVGTFGANLFRSAIRTLKEGCPLPTGRISFQRYLVYGENDYGSMSITCGAFHEALDAWASQASSQFSPFDADWSSAGDMVVEDPSQMGERGPSKEDQTPAWDTRRTSEFVSPAFQGREIFHGTTNIRMAFDQLDPKRTGVSWYLRAPALEYTPPSGPLQGCDVSTRGLGISSSSVCPSTPLFHDPMPGAPITRTRPAGLPTGAWALVVANTTLRSWSAGWSLEAPLVAASRPTPTLEGAAPDLLDSLDDHQWAARWIFPTTVKPGATASSEAPWILEPGPQAEFLESPDDAADSIPHWVALRTATGDLVAGADLAAGTTAALPDLEVRVSRGQGDDAWLRPEVSLVNTSVDTLHAATVRFRLPAHPRSVELEAVLWNAPWPSRGSLGVRADASGEWVVDLHLTGFLLPPGESLSGLQWGAHWADWAPWTMPTLPATPEPVDWATSIREAELFPAPPAHPSEISDLQVSLHREPSEANLHRFRLRVVSPVARTGFSLKLPVEVPAGLTPVVEPWWPAGCSGTLEPGVLVLACPEATLLPTAPWPDATGAAIGLHDTNWQPWPQGATGITAIGAEWTEVNP